MSVAYNENDRIQAFRIPIQVDDLQYITGHSIKSGTKYNAYYH